MFSEIMGTRNIWHGSVHEANCKDTDVEVEGKEKEHESTQQLDELHYYISRLSSLIIKTKNKKRKKLEDIKSVRWSYDDLRLYRKAWNIGELHLPLSRVCAPRTCLDADDAADIQPVLDRCSISGLGHVAHRLARKPPSARQRVRYPGSKAARTS